MKPLVIGIAGGSGSGKSTVAGAIAGALGGASVAFLDMDGYYRNYAQLPMEERRRINWDHPDAFDLDLLAEHMAALAAGQPIQKPTYDFVTHTRSADRVVVRPADVVVQRDTTERGRPLTEVIVAKIHRRLAAVSA